MPSLRRRSPRRTVTLLVVLAFVLVSAFLGTVSFLLGHGGDAGPTYDLGGVAVNSDVNRTTHVRLQVYADGNGSAADRHLAVNRTVSVPPVTRRLTSSGDGVQTGYSVAGQTVVRDGWENPGNFTVRARLVGRSGWSRLHLDRAARAHGGDGCVAERVWVTETGPSGVSVSNTSCTYV